GEKTNGRLILMNTRFGTLTTMSALYFAKLIKKYPTKTRPYNVEGIFEDEPSAILPPEEKKVVVDPIAITLAKDEEKRKQEAEKSAALTVKWAFRLRTLPCDVEQKLREQIKIEPKILSENLEKFVAGDYKGSPLELLEKFGAVKELLKGTEWYVK
ncbi:MAG: hypothetical protein SPL13_05150, partial [Clostridia bacterium]|nr:hypothetical protein [Clostridia bacterium]